MEHNVGLNTNNPNLQNNGGKKHFKFAKMRFTDLKNKLVKKSHIDAEKLEDKTDNKVNEKLKKQIREKEIYQIESELDNKKLLLKIFNTEAVVDYLDEYFSKDGDKPDSYRQSEDHGLNVNYEESKKNEPETLDEFWKKYKNYNDTIRKGLIKNMTPSYGFIKASVDNFLVPNPLGLLKKNRENDSIELR